MLQGRPYEKNHIELILSAIDLDEKYLTFLKNTHEDLSSLFCSELVAHVYQELGLIGEYIYTSYYDNWVVFMILKKYHDTRQYDPFGGIELTIIALHNY